MKLLKAASALLCAVGLSAFGQGVYYDGRASTVQTHMPAGANAPVLAMPGATVLICTSSDCSTPANIYQDQALTIAAPNPLTAGGITPANLSGVWGFWGAAGTLWYKITAQSAVYGPYPITRGGSGGIGGAVNSVFGRAGDVVAQTGDYTFAKIGGSLNLATQVTGLLPLANLATPGLLAGSNITFTGTWPNITISSTGGGITYPSGSGVPVVSSGAAWGTTVAAPAGALVGTTDTQTLTNKTLASPAMTGTATAVNLTVTGTCTGCGAGGGGNTTSTSLTTNAMPKANGANSLINSSIIDDGTTVTSTDTGGYVGKKYTSNDVSGVGFGFIGVDGTQPTCVSGSSGWWADSTANAVRPCNNGVAGSFVFTTTGIVAAQMPALTGDCTTIAGGVAVTCAARYKTLTCQPGLDGATSTTAIGAGTYTQVSCYNATGVTWTITGVKCYTDNSGTSTLNVATTGSSSILTGAVTCTSSWAAATLSGTPTLASGASFTFTFVADASTKNAAFAVTGTY